MKETCENCRFWQESEKRKGQGWCRRNPPRHIADNPPNALRGLGITNRGIWPATIDSDWCGEFEERA